MIDAARFEKRIGRAVKVLRSVVKEARKDHPNAFLYLEASGYLHLMSGPAHSGPGADPRPERMLTTTHVFGLMDAGEW